jgi:ligand-binding sensor domain-containing protein
LSCFDGDKWRSYTTADGLLANAVHSIAVDSKGMLWCATNLGISTYDGSIWKSYTTDDGLPEEGVCYITFDSEGALWFASHGGGIGSFNGSLWKRMTMADGLPDNFVFSVTADDNGRIWVATENGGTCVIQNDTWRIITPEDGLPCRYVRKVLVDKEGAIWFATGGGIGKLQGFEGVSTAVVGSSDRAFEPTGYALSQNVPNPFNPRTTIAYDLPQAADVTLTIYALTGQKVATLVSDHQEVGHYELMWENRGFASGIYLYRLEAGSFVETKRMLVIK